MTSCSQKRGYFHQDSIFEVIQVHANSTYPERLYPLKQITVDGWGNEWFPQLRLASKIYVKDFTANNGLSSVWTLYRLIHF